MFFLIDCQEFAICGDNLHGQYLISTKSIEAGYGSMSATRYPTSNANVEVRARDYGHVLCRRRTKDASNLFAGSDLCFLGIDIDIDPA